MTRIARLRGLCVSVASLLALSAAAGAQDAPMVDAVGAYHQAQVMRHRDEADTPRKADTRDAAGTLSRRQFEALTKQLRAEYGKRVKRDGKPAADRWLRLRVAQLRARYSHTRD